MTPGLAEGTSTDGSAGATVCKNTGSGSSMGVVEIRSRSHSNSSERRNSRGSTSTTQSMVFDSMLSELDDLQRQLSAEDSKDSASDAGSGSGMSVYSLASRVSIPSTPPSVTELNLNTTAWREDDIYEVMNPIEPSETESGAENRSPTESNRSTLKSLNGVQVCGTCNSMV